MPAKPEKTIKEAFEESQKGIHSHDKLVSGLRKTYDKCSSKDDFKAEFLKCLKYPLKIFRREAAVERTLDFAAKFATSFSDELASGDEDNQQARASIESNFTLFIFDFLLKHYNANDRAVRFRVCQMVNKLLNGLGEDASIDDELYTVIYRCMLKRLKDKCPAVRVQAVTALSRLQDPEDADCPVITAYIFLLQHDPNYEVRRVVLSNIAPSTKTLPVLLEKGKDMKDSVRKLAYQVLAEKVSIKSLTIRQRVKLLKDGLNDRSAMVQEACNTKLLQAWLRSFEGNALELLHALDIEYHHGIGQQALEVIFKKVNAQALVEDFDLLNESHIIPIDKLNSEAALYWRCMCEHFKTLGDLGEELLEKLLPSVSEFSDYIESYTSGIKTSSLNDTELEKAFEQEFVSSQLLKMAALLDLSDEVGRKKLDALVQNCMASENVPPTLIECLVVIFANIHDDDAEKISLMAEMISDIREPITVMEKSISEEEKRKKDIKLASTRMELNIVKDELEETVEIEDFSKAVELKEKIQNLENTVESLLSQSMTNTTVSLSHTEKTDPKTMFRCLSIAKEVLKTLKVKGLNPTLLTMIDTLVLPCIKNEDPSVRNVAVQSLGLACLLSVDHAFQHLLLFLQIWQIDHEFIQATSLRVMFDFLLTFGFEAMKVSQLGSGADDTADEGERTEGDGAEGDGAEGDGAEAEGDGAEAEGDGAEAEGDGEGEDANKEDERTLAIKSVLSILTKQLENESAELRTIAAEGMGKLLLAGRISSPKLLSRLLLLWYNPTTEEDIQLRQSLGIFFNMFASGSRANQECIEEAFLPTLQTLFNAPLTSPLAEVNENNVAEFMVHLTDHRSLTQKALVDNLQESTVHDNLSLKICNAILKDSESPGVRTLIKTLNMFQITKNNETLIKDLHTLTKQMQNEVEERISRNMLDKFCKILESYQGTTSSSEVREEVAEQETIDAELQEDDIEMDTTLSERKDEDKENDVSFNQSQIPDVTPAKGDTNKKKESKASEIESAEPTFKTPAVPRKSQRAKKTPATKGTTKKNTDQSTSKIIDDTTPVKSSRPTRNTRGRSAKKEKSPSPTFSRSEDEDEEIVKKSGRNKQILKILNYEDSD